MKNKEVADILYDIADYLEMKDVDWKPRAYRKAARNIESQSESIEEIHRKGNLQEIDGVGESISEKIIEYLETGEMQYYQELKEELPADIDALTAVEGIGPKSVKRIYEAIGVTNLDELENAAEEGRIADIEGFDEKTQQKILKHVESAREKQKRMLIGKIFPLVDNLRHKLQDSSNFNKVQIVGSFRRRKPTIGDIDILATADNNENAMKHFTEGKDVKEVLQQGETKSSIILSGGLQADLRIVDSDSYGSALQYFTGSKSHNVELRTIAVDKDWKLNEYGLFDSNNDKLAGESEESVYLTLDLDYIEPELREDTGEIDAASKDELPDLVSSEDIKGDMQMHTAYSDGLYSVREMAEKADELGYEYILITDHGPSLRVANGLTEEELDDQREEIEEVNRDVDVEILQGIEANITKNGLDIPTGKLEELDFVVAALHNKVNNPTELITRVMRDYPIDILAHPLNRRINSREPLDVDLEKIVETAAEENVALEINSQPARLDLPWRDVKENRGEVKYVVSTDAHSPSELDYMHLGISQARRGWCEQENILNTYDLDKLKNYFQ